MKSYFFWWTRNHLILLHFIELTVHVASWWPSWNTLWLPSDPTAGSLFGFQGIGFGGEGESWCAFRSCLYMESCNTQRRSCMKEFSYNPWGKAALKVESELECAVSQVYFFWLQINMFSSVMSICMSFTVVLLDVVIPQIKTLPCWS